MPLNIAVVGAGVGGLAVAASLARNGHKVTIYERAKSTTDVGFAFRLGPNSDRCLKYLGIHTVAGGAVAANSMRMVNANGEIVAERTENEDAEKARDGTSVFAFRPQVAEQLVETATKFGVEIRTGIKVESVDVEKTQLQLQDGTTVSADLVIGADGIKSAVQKQIFDTSKYHPKTSSGHNCIRFMLPASTVQSDPELSKLINDDYRMASWSGASKRILVYPVDYGRQYNFVCTHPEDLSDKAMVNQSDDPEKAVNYDYRVSLETALSIYSEFESRARRVFELGDPDGFRFWKLQDLEEVPRWSVNSTVLLGDAAHAVLPFGFSGASMAIEDAIVLGELLPGDVSLGDIPARLATYEETRKPRVNYVRDKSREIGQGLEDPRALGEYFRALAEYNAVEIGKEALASCH